MMSQDRFVATNSVEDILRADLRVAHAEIERLNRYLVHLAGYAEDRHPLGVSQADCNDECLTAKAIKYAHSLTDAEP